ncbi:MAG: hypothetical protein ACYCOU_25885 [Sulfobacillus sp.]
MSARRFCARAANATVLSQGNVTVRANGMTSYHLTLLIDLGRLVLHHFQLLVDQQRQMRAQRRGANLQNDQTADHAEHRM